MLGRLFASDLKALVNRAKQEARRHLLTRTVTSIDELIDSCELRTEYRTAACELLTALGRTLKLDPGVLRANDILGSCFTIEGERLGTGATVVLRKYGPQTGIEVFGEDILHVLEVRIDPALWDTLSSSLPGPPRNDDDWIDLIMGFTVAEFLRHFAPILK